MMSYLTTSSFSIPDTETMTELGRSFARALQSPLLIFLEGDLGVGKTTWTRGLLRACGVEGSVKSPTYTLIEPYDFRDGMIYHIDLYRLSTVESLWMTGIEECLPDSVCIIEWPEMAKSCLPDPDLILAFTREDDEREVQIHACSELGDKILKEVLHES